MVARKRAGGAVGPRGGRGGEEGGGADSRAAAGDEGLAPPLPRLARERGNTNKGCNLAAVERAELGQVCDEGACGDIAHADDGGEKILLGAPGGRAAHGGVDIQIEGGELFL